MESVNKVSDTVIALKDNDLALVCLVVLVALGVTAFAIYAVIVAVKNLGDKQ